MVAYNETKKEGESSPQGFWGRRQLDGMKKEQILDSGL